MTYEKKLILSDVQHLNYNDFFIYIAIVENDKLQIF